MLVFTGGIGENDIASRAEICAGLGALGIVLDAERNNVRGAAVISAENSRVTVRVIPPLEDLIIVNHVVRLLGLVSGRPGFSRARRCAARQPDESPHRASFANPGVARHEVAAFHCRPQQRVGAAELVNKPA